MTGNVALDVVIGLVFIFLLYSLLASILAEMVTSLLGLRARNLHKAITRMLENDYPDYIPKKDYRVTRFLAKPIDLLNDFIESFKRFFNLSVPHSTEKFYEHPLIKYSSSDKFNSKPSYLSPQDFSKIIIDSLKGKNVQGSELQKVQSGLTELEKNNSEIAQLESQLLQETDKTNKTKLKADIKKLEQNTFFTKDTLALIQSFLEDAQNDLDKFRNRLETWFDSTMERSKGWFKKTNQTVLLVIGFGIAMLFNVNTIEISSKLINDKEAREQMVALATTYVEEQNGKAPIIDSSTVEKLKKEIEVEIKKTDEILGYHLPDEIEVESIVRLNGNYAKLNSDQAVLNQKYLVDFKTVEQASLAKDIYYVDEDNIEQCKSAKIPPIVYLSCWKQFYKNFWGYLITALAVSLGANFWFDLLNKLVKLRSSSQIQTQNAATNTKTTQTKNYAG